MTAHISFMGVDGVGVAHATDEAGGTGCTVIVCPEGAVGGVDVRGGAPATRETDLLRPEETVQCLHAVVLAGGSAFGLAAADGAMEVLAEEGIGLDVGVCRVPIVSSACLFDLMCGAASAHPDTAMGARAVRRALQDPKPLPERGNVGAGTGCTVGKLAGPERAMKAGLGVGSSGCGPLVCAAVAAVNAVGDVVDPEGGMPIAGLLDEKGMEIVGSERAFLLGSDDRMPLRTNTTISCIVTNARLSKAQATKVAQMAADGYAHAIRPTHTTNDGDAIFVMATGAVEAAPDLVGQHAVHALERAIVDAATSATSAYGFLASRDLMGA